MGQNESKTEGPATTPENIWCCAGKRPKGSLHTIKEARRFVDTLSSTSSEDDLNINHASFLSKCSVFTEDVHEFDEDADIMFSHSKTHYSPDSEQLEITVEHLIRENETLKLQRKATAEALQVVTKALSDANANAKRKERLESPLLNKRKKEIDIQLQEQATSEETIEEKQNEDDIREDNFVSTEKTKSLSAKGRTVSKAQIEVEQLFSRQVAAGSMDIDTYAISLSAVAKSGELNGLKNI